MEAHHTSSPWTYLQVIRSKVNVTRPINANRVNAQYLPNWKTYELQTWYTNGGRRPAPPTSVMTSKVKGKGRKVTWCVWQGLVGQQCVLVSRSKVVIRSTNAETGNASYLQTGKAYELQTWYTDGVRRPISPTSAVTSKVKGHGRKVTWCIWQGCWPISR